MSSGPTSTSSTSYPSWLTGAAQGLLNAGSQIAQTPYTPYTGPQVADLTPTQLGAIGGYGNLASSMTPMYQGAMPAVSNILQGAANPYEQNMINAATTQATNAYNAATQQTSGRFNSPGNWDSARHDIQTGLDQQALATGLGNSIGSIEANQFNTNNQMALQGLGSLNSTLGTGVNALGQAINASDLQRQQMQQVYNTGYNNYMDQRNYPWTQLQNFAGLFTGARGGTGSTTTNQQNYDPISQGIGLYTLGNSLSSGSNSASKGG